MVSTIFGLGLNQQIPIPIPGAPDVIVLPSSQFIPIPGQITYSSGGFSSNAPFPALPVASAPFFATMEQPAAAAPPALPLSQSLDVGGSYIPPVPVRSTLSSAPAPSSRMIGPVAVSWHENRSDPFMDALLGLSGLLGGLTGLLGGPVAPGLQAGQAAPRKKRRRRRR